ncbi:dihydropteroate synthase [Viridibacillus sp. FSL R5-0477]|uniref:Dihydropteroate synthase n=1 Tax=Viridibacillus arenosi FSL R5-213 TaxID=1227360 RepID=W4F8A3_9BACL|nr:MULTISPECIES: dihydropteroate synthase [Viridibacillus]ETT88356.1 dihydropteroate synthase [Viridibacillus arenosi FSL R5-213]OMC81918.1 dihydropteroate synthase [Viridibacillus sp. FSL H7-0596]OMC87581.1 dihydropteroate synthase [Viridibacillus arenosi]
MNLDNYAIPLTIDGHILDFHKETFVMGILNVTPDSFSDGGKYNDIESAVAQAKQMVTDGAKVIDIGGESTRPGHTQISVEEELARVIPIIKELRKEVNVLISIDTYKAEVARQAVLAGAHIINDIWGAKYDPEIASVAAELNVPIILMHNRDNEEYGANFWEVAKADLEKSLQIAKAAGVPDAHIWLDPGIGFAKSHHENVLMMQALPQLVEMGYPVLLATSRKRMIGNILDLPVTERVEGTGATVCFGIDKGCHMVRVHDVKEIARMTRMMDVLLGKQPNVE